MTIAGKGGPAQTEQAKLLYDRWLLDVPKLLDIAALYGPDNPDLTRQLLSKVEFFTVHRHVSLHMGSSARQRRIKEVTCLSTHMLV